MARPGGAALLETPVPENVGGDGDQAPKQGPVPPHPLAPGGPAAARAHGRGHQRERARREEHGVDHPLRDDVAVDERRPRHGEPVHRVDVQGPEEDGDAEEDGPRGRRAGDEAGDGLRRPDVLDHERAEGLHRVARAGVARAARRAVVALVAQPDGRVGREPVCEAPLRPQDLAAGEHRLGRGEVAHGRAGGALEAARRTGAAAADELVAEGAPGGDGDRGRHGRSPRTP
jgi:hypothetical protein